ncbi:MAG: tRNA lysidine(34) synthetase TilS [Woeseiaceae bacterium]|nr:tRNA lysidine(34) synthetase TilS [Woeseiaceae bacterium]
MSFDAASLAAILDDIRTAAGPPVRYVVGFSGGLDSTVLLHGLVRTGPSVPVVAVHVDHGLQPAAGQWARHCADFAAGLGVDFELRRVTVDTAAGQGPEAAAREARYAAFRKILDPGDWLLTGHHGDDQAETVLLNLMRASGPTGLGGIRRCRRFAAGRLVRPLIDATRADLEAYAARHALEFVDDPSNRDTELDRNYLRHEILPRLDARWPGAADRIRQSAALARAAAYLLAELAAVDRGAPGERPDRLELGGLLSLPAARQANVLRHACADLGLPPPGRIHLEQMLTELVAARAAAAPLVAWPGACARRYRDRLYLLSAPDDAPLPDAIPVTAGRVALPADLGVLEFVPGADEGLAAGLAEAGLVIRFRRGGERIKTGKQRVTKTLKNLLQEAGVVPWMRDRLPLVYSGERLVAVADLWVAADAAARPGIAIRWANRPPID